LLLGWIQAKLIGFVHRTMIFFLRQGKPELIPTLPQ
jgi:hypothetical protein